MTVLSLQEAVERTGTSKVDIWRAIQAGSLSAKKTNDGGFAIDPDDLFAVFETKRVDQRPTAEDTAASVEASESPETTATSEAVETELKGPSVLPGKGPTSDELSQDRDERPAVDFAERNAQLAEPAAERAKVEKMALMLRWRKNMINPGGGGSSDGSGRAVAGQPESGSGKGCSG